MLMLMLMLMVRGGGGVLRVHRLLPHRVLLHELLLVLLGCYPSPTSSFSSFVVVFPSNVCDQRVNKRSLGILTRSPQSGLSAKTLQIRHITILHQVRSGIVVLQCFTELVHRSN